MDAHKRLEQHIEQGWELLGDRAEGIIREVWVKCGNCGRIVTLRDEAAHEECPCHKRVFVAAAERVGVYVLEKRE